MLDARRLRKRRGDTVCLFSPSMPNASPMRGTVRRVEVRGDSFTLRVAGDSDYPIEGLLADYTEEPFGRRFVFFVGSRHALLFLPPDPGA